MTSHATILPALLLPAFVINLDTTIVNLALPSLIRELHASTTDLRSIVPCNLVCGGGGVSRDHVPELAYRELALTALQGDRVDAP
jgi:hypothetical protein